MENINHYFLDLDKNIKKAYNLASQALSLGYDVVNSVEIPLAKNMIERVEGLMTIVAPQLKNSGMTERMEELEKLYGKLDWRVAMIVSLEVAQEKFCKFK